jgi:cytochrome oxidase Cu insertion factor (SCO1/SenC/PrrC family)
MKRIASYLLLASLSAITLVSAGPQKKDEIAKLSLKVGDPAPDFTLLSDEWKTVKLSDFRGKKNVLLAVYVLAFTGG